MKTLKNLFEKIINLINPILFSNKKQGMVIVFFIGTILGLGVFTFIYIPEDPRKGFNKHLIKYVFTTVAYFIKFTP